MGDYLLTENIVFDAKPEAVPYNYRISYKVSQVCLIISITCQREGCSLIKLHIISNALNTNEEMKTLLKYLDGSSLDMIVRFDPAVNRAIKYAIADKLIYQLKNGTFKLTNKGRELVKFINKDSNLMIHEKKQLKSLGNQLTPDRIKELMSLWRYLNAEDK